VLILAEMIADADPDPDPGVDPSAVEGDAPTREGPANRTR